MNEVAQRCVAAAPDRVVVISPHSPRHRSIWGGWQGPIAGDLARFGHAEARLSLPPDPEALRALAPGHLPRGELDHGAVVPLLFLRRADWEGPTVVLAPPYPLDEDDAWGEALARLPGRTAVIASGDMSHRLREDAPAGYHPRAAEFDRSFVRALRRAAWRSALEAPARAEAAEDVIDSTRVAMVAAGGPLASEVLSYEGPWGVGYTVAILHDARPALYAIARCAVGCHVRGDRTRIPDRGPPGRGIFVTIRKGGELRGCSGRLRPAGEWLYREVAEVAVSSATRDPRFQAVEEEELPRLRYEVSSLGEIEPVADRSLLDPRVDGVIVSAGERRGVLLPALPFVESADQAIAIALRKAGIDPSEPFELKRFRAQKTTQP